MKLGSRLASARVVINLSPGASLGRRTWIGLVWHSWAALSIAVRAPLLFRALIGDEMGCLPFAETVGKSHS